MIITIISITVTNIAITIIAIAITIIINKYLMSVQIRKGLQRRL